MTLFIFWYLIGFWGAAMLLKKDPPKGEQVLAVALGILITSLLGPALWVTAYYWDFD